MVGPAFWWAPRLRPLTAGAVRGTPGPGTEHPNPYEFAWLLQRGSLQFLHENERKPENWENPKEPQPTIKRLPTIGLSRLSIPRDTRGSLPRLTGTVRSRHPPWLGAASTWLDLAQSTKGVLPSLSTRSVLRNTNTSLNSLASGWLLHRTHMRRGGWSTTKGEQLENHCMWMAMDLYIYIYILHALCYPTENTFQYSVLQFGGFCSIMCPSCCH